jgi:hypothetical protein
VCRAQPGITDPRLQPDDPNRPGGIWFTADGNAVAELSAALVEAGALIRALTPQTASLEDLFFSLTEGGAGERGEPEAPVAAVESVP